MHNLLMKSTALTFLLFSFSAPGLAGLMAFDFSYEFQDGGKLNGSLTGEIQPDLDTVYVTDYSAAYSRHTFPASMVPDSPGGTASFSGNNVSLSGSGLFFGFVDSGGIFELGGVGGFASVITVAFGVPDFTQGETFAAERWQLESRRPVGMVSAPNSLWLMGCALILLRVVGKSFRSPSKPSTHSNTTPFHTVSKD